MSSAYTEQLVKKSSTMGQMTLRAAAIVAGIVITYILLVLVGIVSLVAAFAIIYGIYYLFVMTDIEYEYTLVNGELNIDTVYGRNKRKHSGTYDLRKCEFIASADSSAAALYGKSSQMKTMDFTSGNGSEGVYLMVTAYGAGNARIYFEPNEEMVTAMKSQAPGKFKEY